MSRLTALLLALLLAPVVALAEGPFPALYDVTGVAAGDVLNIRAQPGAGAGLRGALAPRAHDIEVVRVSEDGGWGLVNSGDTAGWASMRYLARQPGQDWGSFPTGLSCIGTEPFWQLALAGDGTVRFGDMLDSAGTYAPVRRIASASRPDRFAFVAGSAAAGLTGLIARTACGDGMSEREYGFALDLLLPRPDGPVLYSGCCEIAP